MRGYDSTETMLAARPFDALAFLLSLYFMCQECEINFKRCYACLTLAAQDAAPDTSAEQLAHEAMRLYRAGKGK